MTKIVPDTLIHLLPQFIESTSNDLEKLQTLLKEKNEAQFRQVLHSLKGNLMLFEVEEMLEVIKRMERLSFKSDLEELDGLLLQINRIYRSLY